MKFCKSFRFFNHTCKQVLQNQKRRNSHLYVTFISANGSRKNPSEKPPLRTLNLTLTLTPYEGFFSGVFFLTPIKIRFFDIKIMFYEYRSSRSKLFCENDVYKRVNMTLLSFIKLTINICVRVLFWKNSVPQTD